MNTKTSIKLLIGVVCYLKSLQLGGALTIVALIGSHCFISAAVLNICNSYRLLIKKKRSLLD